LVVFVLVTGDMGWGTGMIHSFRVDIAVQRIANFLAPTLFIYFRLSTWFMSLYTMLPPGQKTMRPTASTGLNMAAREIESMMRRSIHLSNARIGSPLMQRHGILSTYAPQSNNAESLQCAFNQMHTNNLTTHYKGQVLKRDPQQSPAPRNHPRRTPPRLLPRPPSFRAYAAS
jgi:hypothetical protein